MTSPIDLNYSHILTDNGSVDHNLYDHTDTIRVGEINDTMPDYSRCTGKLYWVGDVAKIGYCGKWLCWKCGKYRLWSESARLIVASEYIHAAYENSYWITINQNEPKTMQISDFMACVGEILDTLRYKARKSEGKPFEYIGVYDFNQKDKIHFHMVSSFMPDDTVIPKRKKSITSKYLDKRLNDRDLHAHIRVIRDAIYVGKYMSGSLHNTASKNLQLPEMFNHIIASRGMPILIKPHEQLPHIYAWLKLTRGSKYYARWSVKDVNGKKIKPTKIPASAVQGALLCGGEVWAKCRNSGEITHYDDYRIVGYAKLADAFVIYTPNDGNFSKSIRGNEAGNLPENDSEIPVSTYDKERKQTLKRILQLAKILANRNARSYNISEEVKTIHLLILYRLQNGLCFYTGKPLTDISVDHVIPLSEGGKNRIENIVLCNLDENLKKSTKSIERHVIELAARGYDHPLRPRWIPVQQTMF